MAAKEPVTLGALEYRITSLAHVLNELVALVARLNAETYVAEKGEYPRVPEKPRISGFPVVEDALKSIRETLEAWMKQWDPEGETERET